MQEIYFRIKEGEESWQDIENNFPQTVLNSNMRIIKAEISKIEPALLREMKRAGPGKLLKPLTLGKRLVVAELETIEHRKMDNELRDTLIETEFRNWIENESNKLIKQLRFEK